MREIQGVSRILALILASLSLPACMGSGDQTLPNSNRSIASNTTTIWAPAPALTSAAASAPSPSPSSSIDTETGVIPEPSHSSPSSAAAQPLSCEIALQDCPLQPSVTGLPTILQDNVDGSATNTARCLQRAQEIKTWCGAHLEVTATSFSDLVGTEISHKSIAADAGYGPAAPESYCRIAVQNCPKQGWQSTTAFNDTSSDAATDPDLCLQKTQTYQTWCQTVGQVGAAAMSANNQVLAWRIINLPPPVLVPSYPSATVLINTPLPALTVTNTAFSILDLGEDLVSCTISPTLPLGLQLNPVNCAITGTPTVVSAATSYAITGTASRAGSATIHVTLAVVPPPPPVLVASPSSVSVIVGSAVSISITNQYSSQGFDPQELGALAADETITSCSGALPAGLSFQLTAQGCQITGTATQVTPATSYTVTVQTAHAGSGTVSVTIAILGFNTLYVSPSGNDSNSGLTPAQPLATITAAEVLIRPHLPAMTSDVTVYLRGGTYPISSPITFGASDSGMNGHVVNYSAYPGDPMPILSGMQAITGWKKSGINPHIYAASANGQVFRDLYYNGVKATRARYPKDPAAPAPIATPQANGSFIVPADPMFTTAFSNLYDTNNYTELAVVTPESMSRLRLGGASSMGSQWLLTPASPDLATQLCTVNPATSSDPNATAAANLATFGTPLATVQQEYNQVCSPYTVDVDTYGYNQNMPTPFWLENNINFVTEPGDWFLDWDTGTVYMYAPLGSDSVDKMNKLDIEAPRGVNSGDNEILVDVNSASYITFTGLEFTGTNFLEPNTYGAVLWGGSVLLAPYKDKNLNVNGKHIKQMPFPAALELNDTQSITVENCLFQDLAADGISMPNWNAYNNTLTVNGSAFVFLGGTAITGGQLIHSNITQNLVRQAGGSHLGEGITGTFATGTKIAHNDISGVTDDGISVGCYGSDTSGCTSFEVYDNKISSVMTVPLDGGAIYTGWAVYNPAAPNPDFEIKGNLIENVSSPSFFPESFTSWFGTAGIYLDAGSTWVTVAENEILNMVQGNPFADNVPADYGLKIPVNAPTHDNFFDNMLDQTSMNAANAKINGSNPAGKPCANIPSPVLLANEPSCLQENYRPGVFNNGPGVTPTSSNGGTFNPGLSAKNKARWSQFLGL